jgi:hypothetical protein
MTGPDSPPAITSATPVDLPVPVSSLAPAADSLCPHTRSKSGIVRRKERTDGTVDEGMTPQVLIIGIPAAAQEQDGHSKPKKPKIN